MEGTIIKDFVLVERLGRGGMGEVWRAEQQRLKTAVAIKLLSVDVSRDAAQVDRFFNEAVAASKIKHAGIVRMFDCGFHDERAYLVMELLEGESLGARMRRVRLTLGQIADVGRQLASVLAATHAAGITHRDLKPDNVLLVPDHGVGSGERVRVLDFGIAKLGSGVTANRTATSSTMGTPAYMAPEQWNNAATVDARADIYSLGCLAFEMACGRPPFSGSSVGEACTQHLSVVPPRASSLATVPAPLDELIARMLAKAVEDRPGIAEIEAGFAAYAEGAGERSTVSAAAATATLATPAASITGLDVTMPAGSGSSSAALPSPSSAPTATVPRPGTPPPTSTQLTTLGGAAGAVAMAPAPAASPRPRGLYIAAGLGVAIAGAIGLYAATRGGADDVVATRSPVVVTPPVPAQPPAPPPRVPTLGLSAVALFHDPKPASVGDLRSESLWLSARDDFADACAADPMDPKHARWCAAKDFADGEAALVRGDRTGADTFRRAIAADPSWAVPYAGLAGALAATGDTAGALEASRHAQRLEPTWWQAVAAGARAYSSMNKLDDAIEEYRRAMTLAPHDAVLLSEIALVYHSAHEDVQADKLAAEALAIDDTLVPIHLMKAERALEVNDGKTGLAEADRVLAVSPKNGAGHLARGDALALLGRKAEAFTEYQRALDTRKDNKSAPDQRLDLVQAAMAKDVLPVPRGGVGKGDAPQAPRSRQPANTAAPHHPPRSRPGCAVGDPLCNVDL